MTKMILTFGVAVMVVVAVAIAGSGCKTKSGSREHIPGKGWVPN